MTTAGDRFRRDTAHPFRRTGTWATAPLRRDAERLAERDAGRFASTFALFMLREFAIVSRRGA